MAQPFPQTERAYLRQPTIFQNKKRLASARKLNRNEVRFTRNVGLGFKAPAEALDSNYVDKKCPFTGNVSIRGRILTGTIASMKMKRTITVRRDYLHFIKKYNRFEKRHSKLSAHMSPAFLDVTEGDEVVVGQCRPLSKTVFFNVLRTKKAAGGSRHLQQSNALCCSAFTVIPSAMSLTLDEVGKHNTDKDCWCIIGDVVYDVTDFLGDHPGGKKAIMLYAGKDATEEFDMLHNRKVIKKYGLNQGTVKEMGKFAQ